MKISSSVWAWGNGFQSCMYVWNVLFNYLFMKVAEFPYQVRMMGGWDSLFFSFGFSIFIHHLAFIPYLLWVRVVVRSSFIVIIERRRVGGEGDRNRKSLWSDWRAKKSIDRIRRWFRRNWWWLIVKYWFRYVYGQDKVRMHGFIRLREEKVTITSILDCAQPAHK